MNNAMKVAVSILQVVVLMSPRADGCLLTVLILTNGTLVGPDVSMSLTGSSARSLFLFICNLIIIGCLAFIGLHQ